MFLIPCLCSIYPKASEFRRFYDRGDLPIQVLVYLHFMKGGILDIPQLQTSHSSLRLAEA